MERMPEKIDSKFRFVLLAAERAERMMKGSRPKAEDPTGKVSRVAMREILHDDVDWEYGPAGDAAAEEEAEEVQEVEA